VGDAVLAALIGVGGVTLVGVASAIMQALNTRWVLREEHQRTEKQIATESRVRREEARHAHVVEALTELFAASDPDLTLDYGRVVRLSHRVHLLLDARVGTEEGRLAEAVNNLGFKVQEYLAEPPAAGEFTGARRDLLKAHAEVLNAARPILTPPLSEPEWYRHCCHPLSGERQGVGTSVGTWRGIGAVTCDRPAASARIGGLVRGLFAPLRGVVRPHNPSVAGSNPAGPISCLPFRGRCGRC
jgi:hypothetical protein